ncbi:MAG: glycosyltransferase [Gemmatimonadota bacterium]|nr:glycosyltransferase [Gemmatimonadota bacterium]HEU4990414.1 glycosyltransferase [Gemmatimonadaceae bacterium]
MRVIFAGGGTGGHLYPGLAIARALVRLRPDLQPYFVGAERGIERHVLPNCEFPYRLLDLHPLHRRSPWKNWRTIVSAVSVWRELGRLVKAERPALVVGTGGYASGLMLEYARRHRIPIVQQVGDSYPGITARRYARDCVEIYLTFPEAARFLRARAPQALVDTGAPIDPPTSMALSRGTARAKWGFPREGGHVVLVYGGSQGSQAINRAVAGWINQGLPPDLYLIWMTGKATYDEFKSYDGAQVRVREYLSPIADAYAAADLAVARAGSMTTSELFAWKIPAILVPLPTAAAQHQTTNAATLEHAGAAIHLPQQQLTGPKLHELIGDLLAHPDALARIADGAARRARPHAAETIAQHIIAIIDGRRAKP